MKNRPIIYISVSLMILASSCGIIKPYQAPVVGKPDLYRDPISTDTSNMANMHWSEIFTDTSLQNLIGEGIANNLNLKIAYFRIQQAQDYYVQSKQAFFPSLDGGASAQVSKQNSKTSASTPNAQSYQLNLNSSWEA